MKQSYPASIVVMGVSGSGKSTLAKALADNLDLTFIEGDDYHSEANVNKMRKGIPLNDIDRQPWLESLNKVLKDPKQFVVLACSALKQSYRDILSRGMEPPPYWVYLEGEAALIEKRMAERHHFMPVDLLQSQLAALEKPSEALVLSCALSTQQQLDLVISRIR